MDLQSLEFATAAVDKHISGESGTGEKKLAMAVCENESNI